MPPQSPDAHVRDRTAIEPLPDGSEPVLGGDAHVQSRTAIEPPLDGSEPVSGHVPADAEMDDDGVSISTLDARERRLPEEGELPEDAEEQGQGTKRTLPQKFRKSTQKKQRINFAEQEDFNYFLDGGNFYQDYAYSVDSVDFEKEKDEVVCLEFPLSTQGHYQNYLHDPNAFVASQARKGRMEVSMRKSTPEEREELKRAMKTEVTSVLSTKAVRVIARKGIDPARLLRCRFVLTWKKDDEGHILKGKARLVVLGFSDPDLIKLRSESPVASRRARQLLLVMAARDKWKLEKGDAVTAFLQGESEEEKRQIFADPPPDVREAFGMTKDEVLQFLKPMYGFVHAPRKWWKHFCSRMQTLGLEIVQCEPCVWVIREKGRLHGMLILHVDDMLIAGSWKDAIYMDWRRRIHNAFEWTPWENTHFVQCGVSIYQKGDFTSTLSQDNYSLNVEPIVIRRGRRPTDELSDKEKSDIRGRLGTVGWRAQQSAPWLSAETSLLQAEVSTATVATLQKVNKLIRTMNATASVKILIPAIHELSVVGWGDAAWAVRASGESQGGELVAVVPLEFLSGQTCVVAPVSWRSNKLLRVARSSTSAEVQQMTETLDEISWVRLALYEIEVGPVDYSNKDDVNRAISACPAALVTDGKSGYDAIERSESAGLGMRDKRTAIECLGIRQQKEQTALQMKWVHSDAMLADGLTKPAAARALLEFFEQGQQWRLVDDPLHQSARKRKARGLGRLADGDGTKGDTSGSLGEKAGFKNSKKEKDYDEYPDENDQFVHYYENTDKTEMVHAGIASLWTTTTITATSTYSSPSGSYVLHEPGKPSSLASFTSWPCRLLPSSRPSGITS